MPSQTVFFIYFLITTSNSTTHVANFNLANSNWTMGGTEHYLQHYIKRKFWKARQGILKISIL